MIRHFSKHARGFIETSANKITLHASTPIDQYDLFTNLKQHDRHAQREKTLSAIIYEQVNEETRARLFKPSKSEESDEKIDIVVGDEVVKVPLKSRIYEGKPSKQDLRVIALTCKTKEEVLESLNYLKEVLKTPKFVKNFDQRLTPLILKRAAKAGNFGDAFAFLTRSKDIFKQFLKADFNSQALRIYALRIPFISKRSVEMLKQLHSRSNGGLGRDLAYLYGLVKHEETFNFGNQEEIKKLVLNSLEGVKPFLKNPKRVLMKQADLEDLVLGYEGAGRCDFDEARELTQVLDDMLESTSRMREVKPSIEINDVKIEGEKEDGKEDGKE